MKKLHFVFLFFAVACIAFIASCNKEGNETNISHAGGTESHNMGQNCMNCHKSGGEGKGWFQAAGTVRTADFLSYYPDAVIRLYTGINGTGQLKATIYGDAKGNFYTTESIDFSQGLYPSVTGSSGSTQYMQETTTSGACNSCHGVSTDKLWVD